MKHLPLLTALVIAALLSACSFIKPTRPEGVSFTDSLRYSLEFETPPGIVGQNIPIREWESWLNQFALHVGQTFKNETRQREVVFQVILQPDSLAEVNIYARPGFGSGTRKDYEQKMRGYPAPKPRFGTCAVRINCTFWGKPKTKQGEFEPEVKTWLDIDKDRFEKLSPKARLTKIKTWASNSVLPLLTVAAQKEDTRYKGVIHLGAKLATNPDLDLEHDPDFWLSILQTGADDQFMGTLRIMNYLKQGQLDNARNWLRIGLFFGGEDKFSTYYINQAENRLGVFFEDINNRIEEARKQVAAGNQQQAITLLDAVVDDYPNSARAAHQLYLLTDYLTQPREQASNTWQQQVLTKDFLFPDYPIAANPSQAYIRQQRLQLRNLAEQQVSFSSLRKQALLAFAIDQYAWSAYLQWYLFQYSPESDTVNELLENFAWCLHKLGIDDGAGWLDLDSKIVFADLEKQREMARQQSQYYMLTQDFNSADATIEAGQGLMQLGEFQLAADRFTYALGLDDKSSEAFVSRGFAYANLGLNQLANADYDRAVRLKPDDIMFWLQMCELKFMAKDYEGVSALTERALGYANKNQEKALCYFFDVIARRCADLPAGQSEELFNNLLKENFVFTNWSFSTFEDWVDGSDLSSGCRSKVENALDQIKDGHY